ncbi:hypothetical protein [Streptomyces griseofuscus]|uniref:hypothetical protein n=1 Tax=Streptomyces griseofuscus TaxID=146922 RepID=UPI0033E3E00B
MPAITQINVGDRLTPSDPPVCCRQPMRLTRGVVGPLWECVDCEDGIYVTADGHVTHVMTSN